MSSINWLLIRGDPLYNKRSTQPQQRTVMLHDSLLVVYVIIEYVYVISGIAINCCILNTINDVSVEVGHVLM